MQGWCQWDRVFYLKMMGSSGEGDGVPGTTMSVSLLPLSCTLKKVKIANSLYVYFTTIKISLVQHRKDVINWLIGTTLSRELKVLISTSKSG